MVDTASKNHVVVVGDLHESVHALVSLLCERDAQIKMLQQQLASGGPAHCQTCTNKWGTQKLRLEKLQLEKLVTEMSVEKQEQESKSGELGENDRTGSDRMEQTVDSFTNRCEDGDNQKTDHILQEVLKENRLLKQQLTSLRQANARSIQCVEEVEARLRQMEGDHEEIMSENVLLHKLIYRQRRQEYVEGSLSRSTTHDTSQQSHHHPVTTTTRHHGNNSDTLSAAGTTSLGSAGDLNEMTHEASAAVAVVNDESRQQAAAAANDEQTVEGTSSPSTADEQTPRDVENVVDELLEDQHDAEWKDNKSVFVPKSISDIEINSKVKYLTALNQIQMAKVIETRTDTNIVKVLDWKTNTTENTKFDNILMVWK